MARELTELEHFLDAAETLQEIQSRRNAIARFQVENVVKIGAAATVFEGHYDDAPAVLKLFHGEDRTERAREQKRELTRLSAFMDRGLFRVAPLLAAWPGEGITVTARIAGTPMDAMLPACGPEERDALIGGAGRWLAHLVASATRPSEFGGNYWVRVRSAALERVQDDSPDGEMARALAERIVARLPTVAGHVITQARCHGDFAPANLIVTDSALYGIDIQNVHWLPLAKDVARFLVYLQTVHPRPEGPCLFGISQADLDVLTAPLTMLTQFERTRFLPFFIGVELADKFVTIDRNSDKAENLRRAIRGFLDSPIRAAI